MDMPRRRICGLYPVTEGLEARILLDAIRLPYLQGVTPSSVYVCVEATASSPLAVADYGLTTSYGSTATAESTQSTSYGSRAVHNIKLTGLAPNTTYHYRVHQGGTTTADYMFTTAPLPGTPARWIFTGDVHTNPDIHDAMAAQMASFSPGMIAMSGDIQKFGGYAEWNTVWFTPGQQKIMTTIPWVEAIGNHEYMADSGLVRAKAFEQAPDGVDDGYFSFDYGDAHIAVMKFGWDPLVEGDPQWNWIVNDLATTTQPWKFVIYHHPAYSYGGHGSDPVSINLTTKVLEPAGVDFVFNGHEHFFQDVLVNGIHHMVSNYSGGLRTPTAVPPGEPGTIGAMEQAFNFFQVDTNPYRVTVTVRRIDGTVIEVITKTKDATPPTAPTGLTATSVNKSGVWLAWNPATDAQSGVDYYNIYRNGTLLGTTPQTAWQDQEAAAGARYTYEVSAVNVGGTEGTKSASVVREHLDTIAPKLRGVCSAWPTEVKVIFDEPVTASSAQAVTNYTIPGVCVTTAALEADTVTVRLTVSPLLADTPYTISVSNVTDTAGNVIAASSQASFQHIPWSESDIGTTGGSSTYTAGGYAITAGGTGIGGTSDSFRYVYRPMTGDGEIITRVTTDGPWPNDKSGVMFRDLTTADSTYASMLLGGASNTLVNYYSFDDTLNDTASAYIQNGGATGTDLTAVFGSSGSALRYAPGMKGNALQLHVLADDVLAARSAVNDADINLGNAWTVELWLKPETEAWEWARLVRAAVGTTTGSWSLQYNMGKFFYANADAETVWGGQLALDQWQHIAAVADPVAGQIRIYRNGILVVSAAYDGTTSAPASGATLDVGSAEDVSGYYDLKGYIDEVATWKEALPQTVLTAHYAAGSAGYGLIPTGGSGTETWFQARDSTGEASSDFSPYLNGASYYTRLVRHAGQFTGYVSPTGLPGTWVQAGPATTIADMASGTIYVGLAATSGVSLVAAYMQDNVVVFDYANSAPSGVDDGYTVLVPGSLNAPPASGVLANDMDGEGDTLAASLVAGTSHGTLAFYSNGAFAYTPAIGYTGFDSFTYKANDGLTDSAPVFVSLAILQDALAPTVTVNAKATDDTTPSLAGTVDDPAATIAVVIGGHTYAAANNGNGTWTLADDAISPALAQGTYDVQATATDVAGNARSDPTTGELIVYMVMADANLDGEIGPEDFGVLKDNFGRSGLVNGWPLGDFNGDGEVGLEDFALLKDNFGRTTYTVVGDANLDGDVGPEDFAVLKDHFGESGTGIGWGQGDFNSDGEVGPEDFALLKDHFGETVPLAPTPLISAAESPAVLPAYIPMVTGLSTNTAEDDKIDILDTLASLTPVLELTVL